MYTVKGSSPLPDREGIALNKYVSDSNYCKFSKIIKEKKIYIYGMGNTTDLYQEGLKRIEDLLHIDGYTDSSEERRNKNYEGKAIVSPEELSKLDDICVLISVGNVDAYEEIKSFLDNEGVENYSINEAIFSLYKNDVFKCRELWEDDLSKLIFDDAIDSFCAMHRPSYSDVGEEYFSFKGMANRVGNETFIDLGAYVGDSIDGFLKSRNYWFNQIIAFEPDTHNFKRCIKYVEGLENDGKVEPNMITVFPYAVGEKMNTVKISHYGEMDSDGLGSKISPNGEFDVKVISIDEFVQTKVDFIKADIESYEYKMLLGAEKTIKKNKPMLAICVYHSTIDLFQIPLLIKNFVPEYKFGLRHYGKDLNDYILYAYL